MLCHLCETFLSHFLASDFTTWKRIKDIEEKWFTFKLGNYAAVEAAALAGCQVCGLFNLVRTESIPNYEGLGEKWHAQSASIDVKHAYGADGVDSKWTFQLLTVAPEMSWIPFEIFKPESAEGVDSETSDWPLEVPASPTSSKSIDIAKQWVQDCLLMHPQCSRADDMPLPTRVVDVGLESEPASPRLLVTRDQSGKYVTLSHCWGTAYRVTLTKNNLPKFKETILLNKLPKTFQDAIQLTRLLGVRYLWIDALCIVQDDQNDWKRESAAMCSVFENANFSISAVAAADSHSGMLHERSPYSVQIEINGMQVGVRQKLDSLPEAMARSRLETRGWCYQERLLPKGILHVAPAQMYWECATYTASETQPSGEPPSQTTTSHITKQASCSSRSNPVSFCREWLHLVSVYSARQVTRPSDRLPAIAGLADKAQKENVDSHYLQGLWSYDLHAGLLWKRRLLAYGKLIPSRDKYFARSSTSSAERPRRPIARSWSWASTNDAVEFPTIGVYSERSPSRFDARVLIPEAHEDEETVLSNMILPLEALVKRGTCRFSSQASRNPDEASFKPSGSLLADDGLRCFLDYVDEPVAKNCYGIRIANWKQPGEKPKKNALNESEQAFFLLLERVQQKWAENENEENSFGVFRRIGMGYDIVRKVDKIFANADRRMLRLV